MPRRSKPHLLGLFLALPLLTAATCFRPYQLPERVSRSLEHSVALPPGTQQIEVQFHDGLLTLEPGPRLEVAVTVELLADDAQALAAMAEQVHPEAVAADRTTRLRVALPEGADLNAVRTTWRVRAPQNASVKVQTRKGGVVARGAVADLEVDGGSGVIDARMDGGTAVLTTTSGSLLLRGDYQVADLRTGLGRIDVQAPRGGNAPTDLRIASDRGGVYLDLLPGQRFDFQFRGETRQVECDPEVRLTWQQVGDDHGVEYTFGKIGDLAVPSAQGKVVVESSSAVRVRLQTTIEKVAVAR